LAALPVDFLPTKIKEFHPLGFLWRAEIICFPGDTHAWTLGQALTKVTPPDGKCRVHLAEGDQLDLVPGLY